MRKLPLNTPTPAHSALGVVGTGVEHDSAWLHTSGQARYIDDLPAPEGLLHAAVGHSEQAQARILEMDLSRVLASPGVVAVITAADVPGHLDAILAEAEGISHTFNTDRIQMAIHQ